MRSDPPARVRSRACDIRCGARRFHQRPPRVARGAGPAAAPPV